MNNTRKGNRSVSPLSTSNFSPDLLSKYAPKAGAETVAESQHTRQFSDSADYGARKRKDEEYYWGMSIAQINLQLDNNMNQLIFQLGKRRNLVQTKKRKLQDEVEDKLERARNVVDLSQFEYVDDEEFCKVTAFCQNPKTAIKILGKIMQTMPDIKGPRNDQESRSEQFWLKNKRLQNEIDVILEKLKGIDRNLQKENAEVHEICRELDRIEDTLKSFVGAKSADHVQKVEPLFHSKKKNYDTLNRRIKDRQISKDKKIEAIQKIKTILQELKQTREERLNEIAQFFGIDDLWQFEQIRFSDQGDFASAFEELLRMKQKDVQLELSQKEVLAEIESLEKEQQKLYSELLRKQSDEAKAFHSYNAIMSQRIKYSSMLSVFNAQSECLNISEVHVKQVAKKFKQYKNFFKRFLDEDSLLKQGLVKTAQTSKTFANLLRATENQKQRRHELLSYLQTCIKKRGEYQQKREQMRHIQFEQTHNQQQLTQYEEDLQGILTDGDLEGYKKIGNSINKCQHERVRLTHVRELLEKQMESMDREVLSLANRIQEEYQDILCDVLPSDYEYSLKTGEDVKKLRNHLRKMYKRLGILGSD